MNWEIFEKMQGVRTTLCFIILLIGFHIAFFISLLTPDQYIDLTKWSWGIYAGAKLGYKGTEVVKERLANKSATG